MSVMLHEQRWADLIDFTHCLYLFSPTGSQLLIDTALACGSGI
jgi:hypothetical protein